MGKNSNKKKEPMQLDEDQLEGIVQSVVDKLKPEINKMWNNLKKENQIEYQQLRNEIASKPSVPTNQTQKMPINVNEIMNDPNIKNIMKQVGDVTGGTTGTNGLPNPTPEIANAGGQMMGIELLKMLLGQNQNMMGGGNNPMMEMMIRNMYAQNNRSAMLFDSIVKKALIQNNVSADEIKTFEKTQNALQEPLRKMGDTLERKAEENS